MWWRCPILISIVVSLFNQLIFGGWLCYSLREPYCNDVSACEYVCVRGKRKFFWPQRRPLTSWGDSVRRYHAMEEKSSPFVTPLCVSMWKSVDEVELTLFSIFSAILQPSLWGYFPFCMYKLWQVVFCYSPLSVVVVFGSSQASRMEWTGCIKQGRRRSNVTVHYQRSGWSAICKRKNQCGFSLIRMCDGR